MAAPRASSFKALRNLQKASNSIPAKRNLHITPHVQEPIAKHSYAPLNVQEGVTKHTLEERPSSHDALQARAYSIAMKRIAGQQARKPSRQVSLPAKKAPTRQFNTSRALKANNDTSTIDFAYLPDVDMFDPSLEEAGTALRVPILPHIESDDAQATLVHHDLDVAAGGLDEAEHSGFMKPQIVTAMETLADGAHVDFDIHGHASAMSEVQDNHGTEMTVDALTNLAGTVRKSAKKLVDNVPEQTAFGRVWSGFLDDLMGARKAS